MKFKKKLKIEDATSFKLEYYEDGTLKNKIFKSYKMLEQFHKRQSSFSYLDYHRYALIGNEWHRFIKVTTPILFKSNLETLIKNFEDENLQK